MIWRTRRTNVLVKQYWHLWFAWHPVKVDCFKYAWLEYVERNYITTMPYIKVIYRLPEYKQ